MSLFETFVTTYTNHDTVVINVDDSSSDDDSDFGHIEDKITKLSNSVESGKDRKRPANEQYKSQVQQLEAAKKRNAIETRKKVTGLHAKIEEGLVQLPEANKRWHNTVQESEIASRFRFPAFWEKTVDTITKSVHMLGGDCLKSMDWQIIEVSGL